MEIKRVIEGKEVTITLTYAEISRAHTEFVTEFMRNTLIEDFGVSDKNAAELAIAAYEKYCEGDGLTEYECIEAAVDEWKSSVRRVAYNIEWDIDDEDVTQDEIDDLPKEIEIPEDIIGEEEISDYVADYSGFCHKGFEIREEEYE